MFSFLAAEPAAQIRTGQQWNKSGHDGGGEACQVAGRAEWLSASLARVLLAGAGEDGSRAGEPAHRKAA